MLSSKTACVQPSDHLRLLLAMFCKNTIRTRLCLEFHDSSVKIWTGQHHQETGDLQMYDQIFRAGAEQTGSHQVQNMSNSQSSQSEQCQPAGSYVSHNAPA
ncbi:hypothetical protein CHARACLAT_027267 [Characodon lateralis]|uniref:Uncharacterized protein n=1 Tax=Characodon lateralis TaxID=208331 RepID=A0ABU7DAJ0_9TELE|nr:hypothetical protein [Characodon lateralis]